MTVIAILLAVGISLQSAASAQAPPAALGEAYALFLQARLLEGRGDVEGAIAAYRRAIAIAPRAADLHAGLAGVLSRANRSAEAVAEAEAALAIDPFHRDAHRTLGHMQAALAERDRLAAAGAGSLTDQAIGHLERSLAGGVRDLGTELTLGRLYVRSGQYANGIERLRQFLADEPGYPEAVLLLADAYEDTGRPALAAAALEELAREQPDQVLVRIRLAELYENAGRWKDAAAAWGDLARRSQRNTSYRTRYATALVNSGDLAEGRRQLLDVTDQAPRDISAWYLLSQVERRAGNADAAEQAARRIADISPGDARGPLALAQAQAARGDYRAVVDTLAPRVKAARDEEVAGGTYARMAADLAAALQQTGDFARAVEVLEDARRRDDQSLELTFALAAAYERSARFDQAERAFRDVIARAPNHADALNYLGYMLADRGEKLDEAVTLVQRALAIEADNPSYLDSLGWAYFKQARLDEAREPLERAATALPKTSVIQDHLGDLYFRLKRFAEAAAAFDRALAGDREGIDAAAVAKKRDRAKELAK